VPPAISTNPLQQHSAQRFKKFTGTQKKFEPVSHTFTIQQARSSCDSYICDSYINLKTRQHKSYVNAATYKPLKTRDHIQLRQQTQQANSSSAS
jgi:hypothetical protein